MRGRRGRLSVAALPIALLVATPAAPADAATGMEVALSDDGIFVYQAYFKRARAFRLARALGVSRIRVNLTWAGALGNHQAKRRRRPARIRYHLHRYDDAIDAAARHGIRVQLTLTGKAPAFATADHKVGATRPSARRYGEFVRAMAQHFKGRVDRYSIWNEPNYVSWLRPLEDEPKIYRRLYIAGYSAIKAVAPRAAVLIGETSPHDSPDRSLAPLDFIRRVACVSPSYTLDRDCASRAKVPGGALRADGYAQHPYDFKNPPSNDWGGRDNVTIGSLRYLTATLDRLRSANALRTPGGGAMPVYLTEFGYFTRGRRRIPESTHARYLPQAFDIARANGRVRQLLQWGLVTPPDGYPGSWFDTSIVRRSGEPREPYRTLLEWAKDQRRSRGVSWPPKRIALPPARPSADTPRPR